MSAAATPPPKSALGAYLGALHQAPLLAPEEERALARRARGGDREAFQGMVRANLRFVVREARRYQRPGLALADLVAEGNLGLLRAVEGFDPKRGLRFTTYAAWWIREAIARYVAAQAGPVALPSKKARLAHRAETTRDRLAGELGRSPRPDELARELQVEVEELRRVSLASKHHIQLDELHGLAGGEDPPDLAGRDQRAELEKLLGRLEPKERQCLRLYFGLAGGEPRTFREVGAFLHMGREGARQVFLRACRKLKAMPELDRLRAEWAE